MAFTAVSAALRTGHDQLGQGPDHQADDRTPDESHVRRSVCCCSRKGSSKASGAPVDVPMAHVLEYRDGRVARLAWYGTRDEAAEAAGL